MVLIPFKIRTANILQAQRKPSAFYGKFCPKFSNLRLFPVKFQSTPQGFGAAGGIS
jgi:hypothetical protein